MSRADAIFSELKELSEKAKNLEVYMARLEKERSDLLHQNSLIEQNIKYMTRKSSITIAEEFEKQKKLKKLNDDRIEDIDRILKSCRKIYDKLKEQISEKEVELEIEKTSKVIPFKRRT